ncbi:MAG: fibronectin type III domain-containing protein [Burkholderiales bacterium]|nr:fibronectin type III domain-containing protein [Burkholderiales bacterium]
MPARPTSLGGTRGVEQVTLSWTAPANIENFANARYEVSWRLTTESQWSDITVNTTSYTVTGLTPGWTYYFKVRVIFDNGFGVESDVMTSASLMPLHNVAIIGIDIPATGQIPDASATPNEQYPNYNITGVSWSDSPSVFLGNTEYTVTVTLEPLGGFTFAGGLLGNVTINGQTATPSENTGSTVKLSYTFPVTAKATLGGTVSINGGTSATFGVPLSANISGLNTTPPGQVGEVTYQWQRNSGSWGDINGATSQTYTPTADDMNLQLRVVVTAAANSDAQGSLNSPETAPVDKASVNNTATNTTPSVAYANPIDLSAFFNIDPNAGTPTYTVTPVTGEGTNSGNIKDLTVTKAGTFTVALTTAATATHEAGGAVSITLTVNKASQAAPAGLSHTNETAAGLNDGTITGVTAAMEWQLNSTGGLWTVGTGAVLDNLAPGTYYIRMKENATHEAGAWTSVQITPAPHPDDLAIDAAKMAVEGAFPATVPQATLNTQTDARSHVESIVNDLLNNTGVTATVNNVDFWAAIAGDHANVSGTNGTYIFTVSLDKGIGTQQVTNHLTLTITATPAQTYPVTVNGSYAATGTDGAGSYAQGATVSISAGAAPQGMQFKNWSATPPVAFASSTSAATTFTMPAGAVEIAANWGAIAASTTLSIPTLNSAGLVFLALLLGGLAFWQRRFGAQG